MTGLPARLIYDQQAGNRAAKEGMCGSVACRTTEGKLRRCGGCRNTRYCSVDCQQRDWPYHRACCLVAQLLPLMRDAVDRNFAEHTLRDYQGYWELRIDDVPALQTALRRLKKPDAPAYLMELFRGSKYMPILDAQAMASFDKLGYSVGTAFVRASLPKRDPRIEGVLTFLKLGHQARALLTDARVGQDVPMIVKIADDGSGGNATRVIPALISTRFRLQ